MFTIIDIETTGLSASYHKITEIAAIKYNGMIIDEFHSLVNPETNIPRFITKLTGIDDDMVKDAPKISEIIPRFHSFLGDSIFVAHNATFDFKFLDYALQKHHNIRLKNEKLCTAKLARRLLPELPRKNLGSLCGHFNINNEAAHRAMGDARATVTVLENFLAMLKEKDIKEIKDILEFQCSKVINDQAISTRF